MNNFNKLHKNKRVSNLNLKVSTLIELLAVIVIIVILAAILFPVFGRARLETRFTTPATLAMITDRAKRDRGGLLRDAAPGVTGLSGMANLADANGYIPSIRHLGGSNFLYVDGHVKFMNFDQYMTNRTALLKSGM